MNIFDNQPGGVKISIVIQVEYTSSLHLIRISSSSVLIFLINDRESRGDFILNFFKFQIHLHYSHIYSQISN